MSGVTVSAELKVLPDPGVDMEIAVANLEADLLLTLMRHGTVDELAVTESREVPGSSPSSTLFDQDDEEHYTIWAGALT